jgi:hypothetical protein
VIAVTQCADARLIVEHGIRPLRPTVASINSTPLHSTPQEITMLLRASILALAMITTLATTALVSTPASAKTVNVNWGDGKIHGGWDIGARHGIHVLRVRR